MIFAADGFGKRTKPRQYKENQLCNGNSFRCTNSTHYNRCRAIATVGEQRLTVLNKRLFRCPNGKACDDSGQLPCVVDRKVKLNTNAVITNVHGKTASNLSVSTPESLSVVKPLQTSVAVAVGNSSIAKSAETEIAVTPSSHEKPSEHSSAVPLVSSTTKRPRRRKATSSPNKKSSTPKPSKKKASDGSSTTKRPKRRRGTKSPAKGSTTAKPPKKGTSKPPKKSTTPKPPKKGTPIPPTNSTSVNHVQGNKQDSTGTGAGTGTGKNK